MDAPPPPPCRGIERWAPLLAGYLVAVAVFGWAGGFRPYDRAPSLVLGTLLGTLLLFVAAQIIGVGRARTLPTRTLIAFIVATPLAFFAWKVGFSAFYEGAVRWWPSKPGLRCLALSLVDGSAVLLGALLSHRLSGSTHTRLGGAATGTAAGAAAWLLVDLWCPVGHPTHVLIGHVLPMFMLAGLGTLIASFFWGAKVKP